MKKLRKLQDGIGGGGAVGNGVPIGSAAAGASGIDLPKGLKTQVREGSVRPWIFDHSRRLRQAGLKRHEIRYMDLSKREAQIIRKKARPKRSGRTQELSGNFLEEEEMVSGDSDGTVDVGRKSALEGFKENPEVYVLGAILFLLIWSLVLLALLLLL